MRNELSFGYCIALFYPWYFAWKLPKNLNWTFQPPLPLTPPLAYLSHFLFKDLMNCHGRHTWIQVNNSLMYCVQTSQSGLVLSFWSQRTPSFPWRGHGQNQPGTLGVQHLRTQARRLHIHCFLTFYFSMSLYLRNMSCKQNTVVGSCF